MIVSGENLFKYFRDWLVIRSGLTWSQTLEDWTASIKQFFGELAKKNGYEPIYTNVEPGVKEYLADIIWRQSGTSQKIILSIESELSCRRDDILYDFKKVMDIKTKHHLGIFKLNKDTRKEILEKMQEIVHEQDYPLTGERMYVIFMVYSQENSKICLSCYEIDFDGARIIWSIEDEYDFKYK